ncbi:oxygen-insensitive NAD(P)H nitroreductase [Marinobacterium sediminicola]|uniref:Nitroreductase / dihydropteridine reductase n=1 Tax=Marinobacterium sediminicola TaxID=518898 RepID=A0ABY1RX91_9GAMM|nr:oxygen-insensitive NAD(P)H nitroreductase [Marinobacterium sediminicola]ULG67808.1 oxygen-insensitive NAD(P)H nitroreductase [Marinobacterium sediminicola]SMR71515.1 nitroreductase / dihydropteridine reductase [Marinobacterium sediminicola]
MNLTDIALTRYSTKAFDPSRKIAPEAFDQIQSLLRYSPSSVNSQPWHFIIAHTDEGKQRLAKGTQGAFKANEAKVLNASHVVLFCAKTEIDDDYLDHLLATEEADGRFPDDSVKEMTKGVRAHFVNLHRVDLGDAPQWMEKQVYLNMGSLLLGAAALGVDAVPLEGIDTAVLNEEFELPQKGFTAVAAIALGYRAVDDFNAKLPKSRLPENEILTHL